MAPEPTPAGAQVFAVVCNLPPGYHQYKFIVDGEWRHDENQAFIQDPLGNVNNWCARRSTRSRRDPRRPRPRRLPDLFGEKQPRLVFPSRGSLPSLNLIPLPRLLFALTPPRSQAVREETWHVQRWHRRPGDPDPAGAADGGWWRLGHGLDRIHHQPAHVRDADQARLRGSVKITAGWRFVRRWRQRCRRCRGRRGPGRLPRARPRVFTAPHRVRAHPRVEQGCGARHQPPRSPGVPRVLRAGHRRRPSVGRAPVRFRRHDRRRRFHRHGADDRKRARERRGFRG